MRIAEVRTGHAAGGIIPARALRREEDTI